MYNTQERVFKDLRKRRAARAALYKSSVACAQYSEEVIPNIVYKFHVLLFAMSHLVGFPGREKTMI